MSNAWLASAPPDAAWAHLAWSEFARVAGDGSLALLPVHGLADHGLGLPLDAEEALGSAVLNEALCGATGAPRCRVLPPLRFGLAPYPSCFFGLDPETAHAQVRELAAGVKAAGFPRLVFFNTSPWNEEFIEVASRDLRAEFDLRTFLIHLGGLGLEFHPASPRRAAAQAAAMQALGQPPASARRPADVRDPEFRPGHFRQPEPLSDENSHDGAALIAEAGRHLRRLLREIAARSGTAPSDDAPALTRPPSAQPWPPVYRKTHYLPALDREALAALPGRDAALVIVPTGSIEQHGHHLPVGVDAILSQAWLAHALPKLPAGLPVYVAPPVTVGKSNEHTGFAGTLSLSAATLRRLLLALATQLRDLGFRQLAVLNTHGGNSGVIVYTLREIQTTLGLRAGMLSDYYRAPLSAQESAYGFHAGEWETSLMLGCAPGLVRMDRAVCEYPARVGDPGELRPEDAPVVFSWITRDVSKSGVMGDATAATAEKGRRWLDEASTALARRITGLLQPPA